MRINDILVEFAPSGDGGGDSGNYFQALASAWYNGTFDSGSLQKGIKSQQDVERLLNRGIVCPDGKTRKLHIDYNSNFDGVEIYSDDYYEYGDHDDTIDSRTGQKWGPYDFMAFSDEDLSEGLTEIDRRGFLKGVGAAAVAGAVGGAKAAQDIGEEGQRKVMDMMGLWYACQNYTNTKYTVPPDICQNAKQSINKFIRNFSGGKEYLNGWYATMHDFEKQEIAKGKLSALTSNVLRDPNYAKQIIRNFDSLSAFDESVNQGVAEGKVKLYTDPSHFGAEIDDTGFDSLGIVDIPANQLVGFEPDAKMNQPKSKVNVEKIVAGLKQGVKLPPLLVRKYKNGYQVLDGHHRFWAYKLLGVKSIPSRIIPDEDIEEISKQGVAEGKPKEKEADYGADYQDMVKRVKKLAGLGPLKTQYDPAKRVYRNMPTAVQPRK